ncbi:LysR family transcriptional regulator, partial [Paracoccus pacificus]
MSLRSLSGLSLRDLEYAVAVRRFGRFNRAAEFCGVSQPTLSGQIRKLEALIGVTLFERYGRRITPTAEGQAVLDQAEQIVAQSKALFEIAACPEPHRGPLRLGAIPTLGPYFLPHVMGPIRRAYPELSLRIHEGKTDELVNLLKERNLDAILVSSHDSDARLHPEPVNGGVKPSHWAAQKSATLARG